MYPSGLDVYHQLAGCTTRAAIRARKRADGTVSYTVQIRIKKNGKQVYTESQTFVRRKAAQAWAKRRETELSEPGANERAPQCWEPFQTCQMKCLADLRR